MKMVNSIDIAEKLAALDNALSDAEADFDRNAAEAVAGVEGAGSEAAAANARIERLKIEQKILQRAQTKALKREAEAKAADEAQVRAQHVSDAGEAAVLLISQAELVDSLTDRLAVAITDLARLEGQVRSSLAAARQLPDEGVVGRKGISAFALDRVNALARGTLIRVSDQRTIADIARIGWRFLLKNDSETEAA
ncbi:hypothetical protein ACFFP0_14315 [Rhizobium puerariae]|uniref:Uncharacterized protein n=1 Tax=Rhizobium puerariae TaxID=1585791 RepID=A0ABV6AL29_9HYPH